MAPMKTLMGIVGVALVLALGCDGGAGRVDAGDVADGAGGARLFADVQYATRCDVTAGCVAPMNHDVCGFHAGEPCVDGSPAVTASCAVTGAGAGRAFTFTVAQGDGPSLSVDLTGFPCTVRVVHNDDVFEGACGSEPPSTAQPCLLSDVVYYDDDGNPTIEGGIFCQGLSNQADPTLTIEVTAIGTGPGPASMPAHFRLANCAGLSI